MGETLAAVTGFSSGFIVAGGVVALMVGLGIITRFIGISHTAAHIRAGENAILFGTVVGTILTVYEVSLPFGSWVLVIAGVLMGTFVGGWIMVSGVLQKAWNHKGNMLDRYLSGNWEDAWKPVPFLYAVGERMKNDKRKIKERPMQRNRNEMQIAGEK